MENNANAMIVYQINEDAFERMLERVTAEKFGAKEIDAKAAAQILGVSYQTVVNWYTRKVLKPSNKVNRGGIIKFRLSDILSANISEIKKQYRQLGQ